MKLILVLVSSDSNILDNLRCFFQIVQKIRRLYQKKEPFHLIFKSL